MNASVTNFIAKSEIDHPYQAKRCFFFGLPLARGPGSRRENDIGTTLGIDMGEMLMVSAGGDVDENTLSRRKHYNCKSAFGATPVDRSGSSARLDFAPDRLAIT